MSGPGTELYVYYRVARPGARAAHQTVQEFQLRLRGQHPGLCARVLQRSDDHGDAITLMEIYSFDDGNRRGVDAALQAIIEGAASALVPLLASPRQTEVFHALD